MNLVGFAYYVDATIIIYFLIVNMFYIMLLISSIPDVLGRYKEMEIADVDLFVNSDINPPLTVIIAAYNEEKSIIDTVYSVLKNTYKNLRVCIVNDGSSDGTLEKLITTFGFYSIVHSIPQKIKTPSFIRGYYVSETFPNLLLIDKEHHGKADSLNVGINACNTPLFLTVDADTILEPQTIETLVYSMLSKPHTVAEGGSVYILDGCKYEQGTVLDAKLSSSPLIAMQTCEYLRAFLFGRTGWRPFGGPLILSGALTLFESQAVIDVGGYKLNSPGEDMEIIVNLHRSMRKKHHPYKIGFSFAAAAWTHVPKTIGKLFGQRARWHRGLIDSLFKHIGMMFNPSYGAVGALSYPFYMLVEFLGPLIEFCGYLAIGIFWYFGLIDWQIAVLFFVASWGLATIITMGTALISFISFNKYRHKWDVLVMLLLVSIESFGFRQMLVICRVYATIKYFFGKYKVE